MEVNSSSDDDVKESSSSEKMGGKKLKLNNGRSQDSFKETVASLRNDENVDSGISADKSESTSSDDKGAGTSEGPSNELVSIAPSGSNIQAILLSISRPIRGRNYRKRKTPDRNTDSDTDSNALSRDSDDLSTEETPQLSRLIDNNSSDTDSDILNRYSDSLDSKTSSSRSASSDTNLSYESDGSIGMNTSDTDSDEEPWARTDNQADNEDKDKTPHLRLKELPKHNYVILREIINREMGLTFPKDKTTQQDVMFERRFYGSLHAVYRMNKLHSLNKHKGCVNSINFHPEGDLLVSGSDDTHIILWDWAKKVPLQSIKTGHKSNVFQSKFLHLNARSQLNIVTCARDGQVRLIQTPPSGGASARRRLACHTRAAHKLHVTSAAPHIVVSAGEDGVVMQSDVRAQQASRLFTVKDKKGLIALYSVHGHPLNDNELVVAGRDKFIRVYDKRQSPRPLALYCPGTFHDTGIDKLGRQSMMHLTCAVYDHDGSHILGSYNDQDIYLFNTKADAYDKDATEIKDGYTHHYSGHRNSATYKAVAFFGPNSEYIVSGSDCSHIYIWDRKAEAIVQWLHGDESGVVNCIESHPRFPVLATSGLDRDVKIWVPRSHSDPDYYGMDQVIRDNSKLQNRSPLFNDFLPTLYSAWRSENRLFSDDENPPTFGGNIDFEGNVCTTF